MYNKPYLLTKNQNIMQKFLRTLAIVAAMLLPFAMQAQDCTTAISVASGSPFQEGFEGGSMPSCWTTDGAGTWSVATGDYSSTTGAHTGTYNAKITHGTTGNVTKLITPVLDMSAVTTGQLSFWHVQRSWSGDYDGLTVYYRTSTTDAWTVLADYSTSAYATWTEEVINLTTLSATFQIAFEMTDEYGYGVGLDDIYIGEAPTCFKVTDLAIDASQTTTSSLTLTWTDAINSGATYSIYNMADNSVVAENISGTTYTVNNLAANTGYTFGVMTDCGGGDVTDLATVSGRTACGAISLPWTCGFEADEIVSTTQATALPWCSQRYVTPGATSGTNYPYSYAGNVRTGSRSFYYYGSTSSSYPDMMAWILPELDVATYPMNANRVTFWAKMGSASYSKYVYVYTVTDPTDITTATLVDSVQVTGTTHTKYSVSLTSAPATDAYLVLAVMKGSGSLYMDDVTLEEMPSCLEVTNLAVSAVTANSITLTWADANNASATYTVYDMADSSIVATNVTGTTYTVTDLDANTAYTFGVEANCASGDAVRVIVNGHTACEAEVLPWTETFAAANAGCWTLVSNNTANASTSTTSSNYFGFTTYNDSTVIVFNSWSTATDYYQYAYSPMLDASALTDADSIQVTVIYATHGTADPLRFGYATTGSTTSSDYTWTAEYSTTGYSDWQTLTFNVPLTANRLAINYTSTGCNYKAYVSTMAVTGYTIPACPAVTGLTATNIEAHGATLSWTGDATGYNVYNMADSTLVQAVADNTVTLTGLSGQTTYTFGVASDCGTEESDTVTVTFTTLISCPAPTGLAATLTPGDGTVATINWHAGDEETAWEICLNGDMTNLISVTDSTYSFTGLTPEVADTVKVRAVCDVDDKSVWTTLVFTPTNAYTITVNDGTTTNNYVPIYGTWVDNITKSQFIVPAASLTAVQYGDITKLTFYASQASVNWGAATFNVYLTETNETTLSALGDYTTMTQVYTGSLSIVDNQMEVTFTTPFTYMGGNLMIGFLQTASGTWSGSSWYGVEATGASMGGYGTSISQQNFLPKTTFAYTPGVAPACMPVTGLTAINVATDSARLIWEGDATSYNVYAISAIDTQLVTTVTDTTVLFETLTPMTTYKYGVTSVCGSDESNMVSVTFTTACAAIAVPFTENFETTSPTFQCWTVDGVSSTGLSDDAFLFYFSTNPPQYLVSPELSGVTDGLTVSFRYKAYNNNYPESFQLGYSTTTNAYADFTWLAEVNNITSTSYTEYSQILSGAVKYVAVKYTANDQYGLYIDSMVFAEPPACMPVTDLTVDSVTATSVFLSWNGTAAAYNIYSATGNVVATGVTTTNYEVTGLTASTNYTFGVASVCGSDQSDVVTVPARTDCAGGSCTIKIYAEDNWGDGWADEYGAAYSNITISQNGATVATYSMQSQNLEDVTIYDTFTVNVCSGVPVTFTWNSNSEYDNEASFKILDGNDTVLISVSDASMLTDGAAFLTANDACGSNTPIQILDSMKVTVAVNNATMGTTVPAPGVHYFYEGEVASVVAQPAAGYHLVGWTVLTTVDYGSYGGITTIIDTTLNIAEPNVFTLFDFDTVQAGYHVFEWTVTANFAAGEPELDTVTLIVNVPDPTRGTTTPAPGTHYFTTGQTLSLTAQPAAGYMLADWMYTVVNPTGDTVVDAEYADTNVTEFFDIFEDFPAVGPMLDGFIINVTPIFQGVIPTTHTVTVTSMNPQMGTVNPEGDSVVNDGSSFTATANANEGYHFVNWVDAGSNVITDNPYTFVVNSNVTLRAVFAADSVAPTIYTVTVNVNDSTMGHVTGVPTAPVTANTVISLTAVPEAGYHFVSWSNGANTATITVTVTSDTVLTATFAANPADTYTLTVAYDATMGSVEGIPEGPVAAGTVVTLTAMPAEGYHFVEWSTGETTATISVTVNSNMTLTATFAANAVDKYVVSVLWDATMGNVTGVPTDSVPAGSSVTLMANPLEGYQFVAWLIGQDTVGHNAVYTIDSVSHDVTLVAIFAVKTGIEDVEMSNVKIYSAESVIYVMGAEGQNVYLYDLNGRVINAAPKAGERVEFRMNNTGVYLVKVGTAAAKRVVVTR